MEQLKKECLEEATLRRLKSFEYRMMMVINRSLPYTIMDPCQLGQDPQPKVKPHTHKEGPDPTARVLQV